jgi:hypothetical protein
MQALWRTLRNNDSAAMVAFRVLGKFGGGNRKMMIEPQRLDYNVKDSPAPAVVAYFQEKRKPIDFPVDFISSRFGEEAKEPGWSRSIVLVTTLRTPSKK